MKDKKMTIKEYANEYRHGATRYVQHLVIAGRIDLLQDVTNIEKIELPGGKFYYSLTVNKQD